MFVLQGGSSRRAASDDSFAHRSEACPPGAPQQNRSMFGFLNQCSSRFVAAILGRLNSAASPSTAIPLTAHELFNGSLAPELDEFLSEQMLNGFELDVEFEPADMLEEASPQKNNEPEVLTYNVSALGAGTKTHNVSALGAGTKTYNMSALGADRNVEAAASDILDITADSSKALSLWRSVELLSCASLLSTASRRANVMFFGNAL